MYTPIQEISEFRLAALKTSLLFEFMEYRLNAKEEIFNS